MPGFSESREWVVVAYPLYASRKVLRILRRLEGLTDSGGYPVTPAGWWKRGTYYGRDTKRAKSVVIVFQPRREVADLPGLVEAAGLGLEERSGLILDWCSGTVPNSRKTYMVIKTLAASQETGRSNRYFKLRRDDLAWVTDQVYRALGVDKPRTRPGRKRG